MRDKGISTVARNHRNQSKRTPFIAKNSQNICPDRTMYQERKPRPERDIKEQLLRTDNFYHNISIDTNTEASMAGMAIVV